MRRGRPRLDKCKHGHDMTDPANVVVRPAGTRYCKLCNRLHAAASMRRMRARNGAPRQVIVVVGELPT